MIKVTVLKNEIDERGGSFKNDAGENVEYTTRKQKAKLETGGFAYPYDVRLDKGQPGYPRASTSSISSPCCRSTRVSHR